MEEIRKEIINLTKKYAKNKIKKEFIPGKTTIPFAGRVFDEEEYINLVEASLDGWLTTGRFAEKFEYEFAKFLGIKSVTLVNSGSSANLLALTALTSKKLGDKRIKPGDEVITVAAGFPTTVNPIIQNGAIPVFIDVDIPTYNIKAEEIESAITEKTKAIMIAHTLGNPFNLDEVMRVAKKHNLWVIEDTCDALGSTYDGKLVGTFGDIATVSFYPAHHITMGEGGAILTNNLQLERLVKSFRDWGRDCYCEPGFSNTCGMRFKQQHGTLPFGYDHKYVYSHIGYNLKLTDMQAAVGVAQLKKLPEFIEKRKRNFKLLKEGLKKYEDYLILPEPTPKSDPSWFGFPITIKDNDEFSRWDIVTYLEKNKIMTRMLFGGNLTRQPAYADVKYKIHKELINTDIIMNNTFFIGVYPGITDEMIEYIINTFEKFFEEL
ncbi:CDP-6-deoxy-D-xylo-4-hexulose-3-dehydrase [Marinitoga hydrogenitolerans DSM 16785]|uniref:CDP-6-deoxy-D-xylo-4-hexulose-3-dehydrase n=1 Tax=Marinitoga hydrogenitolerans (strain DSM 16785 / JCM 12826 / AT1271) TaxID=1122195 RepID=A0A1M4ZCR2_MARH1|nr:lipopolysaccharide biosynthesis protein RfbH [Marinitoga hydrogenitolerans]SHF15577.1 CDP-6-deoxy-D-xylo-4-hexulose-3-dehydrase [Marinitoga hydrogenitolerans DSM 16785]